MSSFKVVYQCNENWIYIGETIADEDQLNPNTYLIPMYAVEEPPPQYDPSLFYVQWQNSEWVVTQIPEPEPPKPPTREEIIQKKKLEIDLKRDRHCQGGIFAHDHWWSSSTIAQQQWSELKGLARDVFYSAGDMDAVLVDINGETFDWKTLDNGYVSVTPTIVNSVTNQAIADVNKNFKNATRHKEELSSSEFPEVYDYSDGWTEIWSGYTP